MTGSTSVSIALSPAPVGCLGGGSVCGGGPGVSIYLGGSAVGIDYKLSQRILLGGQSRSWCRHIIQFWFVHHSWHLYGDSHQSA